MKTFGNMLIAMTIILFGSCVTSADKKIASKHSKSWNKSSRAFHKPVHSSTMLISSFGSPVGTAPSRNRNIK